MKIRSLLIASALTAVATAASAATFEWTPVISQPYPTQDITLTSQLNTLILYCYETGVTKTDVMPKWIDEEGNEIVATSGEQDPWNWDASEFDYYFDTSSFKCNGEYILEFPEGMLVNPAGELSAKVETQYTFDVPELKGPMFDDFEVVSLSPDLSQAQGIWSDQTVTISTNHNDAIGLTVLRITDKSESNAFVLESTNFTTGRELGNSSEISWSVVGDYKFFEGHTYVAEFVFYNGKNQYGSMGEVTPVVDRIFYEFTGKVEAYKYSSVKLESVTPDPFNTVISSPDQAVFKYVFSGPVDVYKAVTPKGQFGVIEYPETCLKANEDKTEWTLDLSGNEEIRELDAELVIQIYARDSDGLQLVGNEGSEAEACYQYSWECELGAIAIEVVTPAANAELDRLTEVVVKSSNKATMDWSWTGTATIETMTNEVIGQLVYESSEVASKEIKFTKWTNANGIEEPIDLTEAGTYKLIFSHGCFVFGEQFDSKLSHSVTSEFSITGNASPGSAVSSVSAVATNDVYDMHGRIVMRSASKDNISKLPKGIYIINGKKFVVK